MDKKSVEETQAELEEKAKLVDEKARQTSTEYIQGNLLFQTR